MLDPAAGWRRSRCVEVTDGWREYEECIIAVMEAAGMKPDPKTDDWNTASLFKSQRNIVEKTVHHVLYLARNTLIHRNCPDEASPKEKQDNQNLTKFPLCQSLRKKPETMQILFTPEQTVYCIRLLKWMMRAYANSLWSGPIPDVPPLDPLVRRFLGRN